MEPGLRLTPAPRRALGARAAWCGVAALLALGALLGTLGPAQRLDWQPALAAAEPWRAWTAAFVHLDRWHLLANLAGAAVLALLGVTARSTGADVWAWLAAWPLTHALLGFWPAVQHYAGLSGALHAGVAVAALGLVLRERGRVRAVGALILAGLLLKLLDEAAWDAPVRRLPGWDFPVAVLAHATGVAAGLACAGVAWATSRRKALATMRR
ncbi:MAG: rhombosortase [Rubrivivax sp.]|nr:rhombosortase [Rubrivivax sp.]